MKILSQTTNAAWKEFRETDTLAIPGDTDSMDIRDRYLASLFKDC